PAELAQTDTYSTYTHDGVRKRAVHLRLNNGMQLVVCAPLDEIDSGWRQVVLAISGATVGLALLFSLIAARFASRITKPLQELTVAAGQMNEGDYDIELNYEGNDEVGVLARAFSRLIAHLRVYGGDLSTLAYADALTNVSNKGAFDVHMRELDERLGSADEPMEFALGMFDCDGLKQVNDEYGHEKGDLYLQASCAMIPALRCV
ncbi:MAG: HAMP domain-containing protein, partial [Coriobacteriales bacterium]|nr:HAMP domain-containing protein [Coriobacteriales bacterium]